MNDDEKVERFDEYCEILKETRQKFSAWREKWQKLSGENYPSEFKLDELRDVTCFDCLGNDIYMYSHDPYVRPETSGKFKELVLVPLVLNLPTSKQRVVGKTDPT